MNQERDMRSGYVRRREVGQQRDQARAGRGPWPMCGLAAVAISRAGAGQETYGVRVRAV